GIVADAMPYHRLSPGMLKRESGRAVGSTGVLHVGYEQRSILLGHKRHIAAAGARHVVVAIMLIVGCPLRASAGCPREPLLLDSGGFALTGDMQPLPPDARLAVVSLPDAWRERRPEAGGLGWYRFTIGGSYAGGDDPRCGVFLPDVN